jgi:signal transduction histidine kinase
MKRPLPELLKHYTDALREYLDGGGETALQEAYELGRRALTEGLGVLDMASLHAEALACVLLPTANPADCTATVTAGAKFFAESLSPFEMTHRGYQEANLALRHLNEMLEEEAKRIAHALHDEAGQLLASVYLALEQAARDLPPPAADRLQWVRCLLDQIEVQLRRLSHELRPTILDDLGLLPALDFLAKGVSTRTGIHIAVDGSTEDRLPRLVETPLYRIVQEALTNVAKHARATQVTVYVRPEEKLVRCSIRDNGVGFDANGDRREEGGLGLRGIKERLEALGGSLQIISSPGQGTELVVTIPLET